MCVVGYKGLVLILQQFGGSDVCIMYFVNWMHMRATICVTVLICQTYTTVLTHSLGGFDLRYSTVEVLEGLGLRSGLDVARLEVFVSRYVTSFS